MTVPMVAREVEALARRSRLQAREHSARRIQCVFRGWRTRKRVLWAVRAELETFMNEMEADVEMERLLLGLPKPQVHTWHCERGASLRLPRIGDDVFGWSSSFPEDHTPSEQDTSITAQVSAIARERPEREGEGEKVDEKDGVADSCESGEHSVVSTAAPSPASSNGEDDQDVEGAQDADVPTAHSFPPLLEEHHIEMHDEPSPVATCDVATEREAPVGAVESDICSSTNQANLPMSVDRILATHSKAEIELELEWARQALRDRLQYLRNRVRVAGS